MRISFGPFDFDRENRLLWRDGAEIALPPRVLGVLEVLIDRAGHVVARQDLLDRVWKDAFVTDTSLAEAVSFLRQALGDDPQSPRYIQTVHRRGYRFLPSLAPPPSAPAAPPDPGRTRVERPSDEGQTGVRPGSDHLRPVSASERVDWQLVPWSVAALCAGLAVAAVWHGASRPAPDAPPVSRFEVRAARGTAFDGDALPIAIAPDGRTLAWSACEDATGRCAIYARAVERLDAQPLAGTDGGHAPAFSPDGRWIAFFADGALKKIAAGGGAPTTLAGAPDPAGAAWTADGRIVFAGSTAGGLTLVDDQGGAAQPLTRPLADRGELRHAFPASIPGALGTALAFTVASSPDGAAPGALAFLTPDSPGIRTARTGVHRAVPAGPGYLLLATATDLQAATFDARTLWLTGATDSVPAPAGDGVPRFAVGAQTLALVRPPAAAGRVWSDGGDASPLARFTSVAISPDSRRAAGVVVDRHASDIWIADLASRATTRVTFDGTNVSPAWSADGQELFFATRNGATPFHVVSLTIADRADRTAPVAGAPAQAFPTSSARGRLALTRYQDGHTAVVLTDSTGGAARALGEGPYDEGAAAISPDGRWVALESSASGRVEVIVRAADDGRRVAAVSADGGRRPQWSVDGRAIFYVAGRRVMRATFSPDAGGAVGRAEAVLDRAGDRVVAIAPSGRILVDRQPGADSATVVLQWLRELRERLPLPVSAPR